MSEKKQLSFEELEKVTGGTGKKNCPYFVQALRKSYTNQCENCRFYNMLNNKEYSCTHPSKTGKQSSLA